MKIQINRTILSVALLLVFVAFLAALRFQATHSVAQGIVLMGEGSDLGGITYQRSQQLLDDYFQRLSQEKITFDLDGNIVELSLAELGVSFDSDATVERIREISYGKSLLSHYGMRLTHIFKDTEVSPVYQIDQNRLIGKLQTAFPILQGAMEAEINYDEAGNPFVVEHQDRLTTDFQAIITAIPVAINSPGKQYRLAIESTPSLAKYQTVNAESDLLILEELLKREINFTVTPPTEEEKPYIYKTKILPNWIIVRNGELNFSEDIIAAFISENIAPNIDQEVQNAIISTLPEEGSNFAIVEGIAIDGRKIDIESTIDRLKQALQNNENQVEIEVQHIPSKIENHTGENLGSLEHLGQGRSGFWGSAIGRKANIKKGLTEKVNNVLVAPGEEYSFNSNLGPVTNAAGWYNADAIFNGDELIPVPGGGLCQVSTTVYRAALNANLEILERYPHSLYVLYYEEFGNGLDAAIYPGHKDLRFKNTTDNYLLVQAHVDGDFGYVDIYGTPTGDKVELLGPIYSGRVPEQFQELVNPRWNEISWIQKITKSDGTIELNPINSRYRTAPRKVYPYSG
ncbi:hypothetical protein CVV38_02165 [Candidatus Peregrinibacteria bacterium HGW-Peregrinibacteria-1]|jgi:vancomycin resistance protein YoaR|nr:MAG: hypothetical protein CVV38_02165 [Candidatus Peregrinibacteria bacterium HGW-Peregrinibacteria-1]